MHVKCDSGRVFSQFEIGIQRSDVAGGGIKPPPSSLMNIAIPRKAFLRKVPSGEVLPAPALLHTDLKAQSALRGFEVHQIDNCKCLAGKQETRNENQ
jgi:hypothetical protein